MSARRRTKKGARAEKERQEGERALEKMFEEAWDGKTLDMARVKKTAQTIMDNPAMEEITESLRGQFTQNIYHFSAAKNYHELRALSQAVYHPITGRKKSFKEFKQAAAKINEQYNKNWLRTEQNFAYGATLMAQRWEGFSKEDMLQYKTQGDGAVRDSHRALHNIIKPKTDAFWDTCYPPNGWGCRCLVVRINAETPTKDKDIPYIDDTTVPLMFRVNYAKQGIIFPPKHPYFTEMPQSVRESVAEQAREAKREAEEKKKKEAEEAAAEKKRKADERGRINKILNQPVEAQYETLKKYANGGKIEKHLLVEKNARDYPSVLQAAQYFAEKGMQVKMLPMIHVKEKNAREKLLPDVIAGKNPDLLVGKEYVEVKEVKSTKRRVVNERINKAKEQANIIVIILPEKHNHDAYIQRKAKENGLTIYHIIKKSDYEKT